MVFAIMRWLGMLALSAALALPAASQSQKVRLALAPGTYDAVVDAVLSKGRANALCSGIKELGAVCPGYGWGTLLADSSKKQLGVARITQGETLDAFVAVVTPAYELQVYRGRFAGAYEKAHAALQVALFLQGCDVASFEQAASQYRTVPSEQDASNIAQLLKSQ